MTDTTFDEATERWLATRTPEERAQYIAREAELRAAEAKAGELVGEKGMRLQLAGTIPVYVTVWIDENGKCTVESVNAGDESFAWDETAEAWAQGVEGDMEYSGSIPDELTELAQLLADDAEWPGWKWGF